MTNGLIYGIIKTIKEGREEEKMRKLIIHETDIHGSGYVQYNGNGFAYWSDGDYGNVKGTVEGLIGLGFIKEEDVIFIDGDEIYEILDEALANAEGEN